MASVNGYHPGYPLGKRYDPATHGRGSFSLNDLIVETWSQGVLVGGLMILILVTLANMRKRVLLHKLILTELVISIGHGTFIFFPDPVYGWYLSSTAALLYLSFFIHNIVSWMKIRAFLPRWGSRLFIFTILLTTPYWVLETFFNFEYFNGLGNNSFTLTRPWEAPMRDVWWVFTTCKLIHVLKRTYTVGLLELIKGSPRFGVLIGSMLLSIAFMFIDIGVTVAHIGNDDGVNPYWKFYVVFKCAADVTFLDEFKKVLDTLMERSLGRIAEPHWHDRECRASGSVQQPTTQHVETIQPGQSNNTHRVNVPCSLFSRPSNRRPTLSPGNEQKFAFHASRYRPHTGPERPHDIRESDIRIQEIPVSACTLRPTYPSPVGLYPMKPTAVSNLSHCTLPTANQD